MASSPTLSLAGQTTLARVHVSEPRVGRPLLQSGRDDEDAFRGRARPCDAHSAPGCSVTCPRHRARRAGSTRTDQSFIYKKKKLKPVLNSSRSCSGPSRDENPVFGSHRIPQDRRVPLPVLCSQGTAPASQLSVLTRHGRRSFLERLVQTSGPVAPCLGLPGLRGRFGQKVGHAVLC